MVCRHLILVIFVTRLCRYAFLLVRVFTYVRLGIVEMRFCVYDCVVVEGVYTCKTGNFGNETLCL